MSILTAPKIISAFAILSLTSSVMVPKPIPKAARLTFIFTSGVISLNPFFEMLVFNILSISVAASSKVKPSMLFTGRLITKHLMPSNLAASIRSASPLPFPLFFKTTTDALHSLICALFMVRENGPCIAIICLPLSPLSLQRLRLSTLGITLAIILFLTSSFSQNVASSLLPVVRNIFPDVF